MEASGSSQPNVVINNNVAANLSASPRYDAEHDRMIIDLTLREVEGQIKRGASPISRAMENGYQNMRRKGRR